MKGRDGDNYPLHLFIRCSQKLGRLEKNGNCSYPVGEGGGTARRSTARRTVPAGRTARHNITCATLLLTYSAMKVMKQDSSFSYFVFLWLHPPQRGCHWNRREAAATRLDEGVRARRAGRAVTAGPAGWAPATVLLSTLCCFSNFMKKKGRSGTAGRGIAGATVFRHVAADKLGRRRR